MIWSLEGLPTVPSCLIYIFMRLESCKLIETGKYEKDIP